MPKPKRKVLVKDILRCNTCWTRERIKKAVGDGKTIDEIFEYFRRRRKTDLVWLAIALLPLGKAFRFCQKERKTIHQVILRNYSEDYLKKVSDLRARRCYSLAKEHLSFLGIQIYEATSGESRVRFWAKLKEELKKHWE